MIILEGTPRLFAFLTVGRKDHSSYSCHFSINLASFRLSLAMSPLLLAVFAAVCLLLSSFRPESVVRRRRRTRKCTLVLPSFLPSFLPTLSFLVHFLPPQSIHLKVRPSVRGAKGRQLKRSSVAFRRRWSEKEPPHAIVIAKEREKRETDENKMSSQLHLGLRHAIPSPSSNRDPRRLL